MLTPRLLSASRPLRVRPRVGRQRAPLHRSLPARDWSIEFANGVVECGEIRKDGTASESEPNGKSNSKAVVPTAAYFNQVRRQLP
jgi:hypothetical protein